MATKNKPLFLFLDNFIQRFDKYRNTVLIGLFFSIVITTINSTGNGVFFFTVHATPDTPSNQSVQSSGNKTHVELGNAFLNVITEVKNPFTFSGFIINGTHRGPEFGPVEGSLTPKGFTYRVFNDIGDPLAEPFPGKPVELGKGQIIKIAPGSYRVVLESPILSAYVTEMSPDCDGTIKVKEIKECIVTHTFVGTATLNVITTVDNTGGGTAKPEDFKFLKEREDDEYTGKSSPGQKITLFPEPSSGAFEYLITPRHAPGYIVKTDGDCKEYPMSDVTAGETKECTLTYKFVGKATLKLITTVDNTGGGSAKAEDFLFHFVNNEQVSKQSRGDPVGKLFELSAGIYSLASDTWISYYPSTESEGCWGIIAPGETKDCHVVYTFKEP